MLLITVAALYTESMLLVPGWLGKVSPEKAFREDINVTHGLICAAAMICATLVNILTHTVCILTSLYE